MADMDWDYDELVNGMVVTSTLKASSLEQATDKAAKASTGSVLCVRLVVVPSATVVNDSDGVPHRMVKGKWVAV